MDLYRGKSVKSGMWFIGAVVCLKGKAYILLSESLEVERPAYNGMSMGYAVQVKGLAVDPYTAMEHGWTEALDCYEERMPKWEELELETVTRCTTKIDKKGNVLFEGDVIEEPNGELYEICYGKYEDQIKAENVGFFKVSLEVPEKGPSALGATEEYALLISNVFDVPQLLEGIKPAAPYADQSAFSPVT